MSRTRPTEPDPDPRFPFPHTTAPTRCRRDPALFDLGFGDLLHLHLGLFSGHTLCSDGHGFAGGQS